MVSSNQGEYKIITYQDENTETDDCEQSSQQHRSLSTRSWHSIMLSCLLVILSVLGITILLTFAFLETSKLQTIYESVNQSIQHSINPSISQSNDAPLVHINHQRWAAVLQKLADGKQIVMGFHGGSITLQPWAYHTQLGDLLINSFPINETLYINDTRVFRNETTGKPTHQMISRAAGGMTSDAASLCVSQSFADVQPDIVGLEYAVNDHYQAQFTNTDDPLAAFSPTDNIERFARNYLSRPNGPAIFMPLFAFDGRRSAESDHMKAAIHYGIPTISWSSEYLLEWRTLINAYAPQYRLENIYKQDDHIHPNSNGHHIMAQLIHSMIMRMFNSFIASNHEDLGYSPTLSRRSSARQSLLDGPPSTLPEPLNPAVKWTSSPASFCRLVFRTFWGTPDEANDANVYQAFGIEWHPGFHMKQKPSFRPLDLDQVGQNITFQSPVSFNNAAILFITRSWNTTWSNGTAHLSSSARAIECDTRPVRFESTWNSSTTQTVALIVWSALGQDSAENRACVRDLITVTKISTGDMQIAGFYAN